MDEAGLRSLLKNEGYLEIIDHANYNPRLIEWITGLAGHRLSAEDNKNLHAFALRTLDRPETLWQHAFEQELDAHARAVLFCLVVLPEVVGLDDLEQAFEALSAAQHRTTSGKAFQGALSALDDSMVRTLQTNRGVHVEPHSPSVVDYVRGYLVDSPGDATAVLESAVFWEQVATLWALLSAAGKRHVGRHAGSLSAAVERCITTPGLTERFVAVGYNAWTIEGRGTVQLADRLTLMHEMRAMDGLLRRNLEPLWVEKLAQIQDDWSYGHGSQASALGLLKALKQHGALDQQLLNAAKVLFSEDLSTSPNWEWLRDFQRLVPDAWDLHEQASLADDFSAWLSDELEAAENHMDEVEDVWRLERLAEDFGVSPDPDELESAVERLREAEEERETEDPDRDEYEPEPKAQGRHHAGSTEEEQIAALFAHLRQRGTAS